METSLLEKLREIDTIPKDNWIDGLRGRKKAEAEFHDRHSRNQKADDASPEAKDTFEKLYGSQKYYVGTALSTKHLDDWISAHAPGKTFLDYCCGNGGYAIKAAAAGAEMSIGIDISPVSIVKARADAAASGVEANSYFLLGDAENTKLPDGSVDAIICWGVLHHIDLSFAFPELRRILAPGGVILCGEALDYNPAIKAYRYLTPGLRTEWEKAHILTLADVSFAKRFFDVRAVRYWHLTSPLGAYAKPVIPALNFIDRVLTRVPLVRLMSWIFTFELYRRDE